ncbi:MAG: bifunctional DNA-formamidopyrimidine glycosylase/DNA-(apurinic or apyrimidinic site) lyase [Planctomycetota bacterium]
MPELPEVETTRLCLLPHVAGRRLERTVVRERRLRWTVSRRLERELRGKRIHTVERRAKYLLFRTEGGTVILHLGMSGSLRLTRASIPPEAHDHVDFVLDDESCLRLRDPRRFGCVLWTRSDPLLHPLLRNLGLEPLSDAWNGATCHRLSRGRSVAVKSFIMNSRIVVGVGNIYANEALFRAHIHPARTAGRLSRARCDTLVDAVKDVLREALQAGGTTLRDYVTPLANPGGFHQHLEVYERAGEPCPSCGSPIRLVRLGQRSTYFCKNCQR